MPATSSSTTTSITQPNYKDYYTRRLARSLQRHAAARNQSASHLAREFFDVPSSSPPSGLARRVIRLAERLRHDDNVNDVESSSLECRRTALSAAVFARAPPSFVDDWRRLFESLLERSHNRWHRGVVKNDDDDDVEVDNISEVEEEQFYHSLTTLQWTAHHLRHPFFTSLHDVTHRVVQSMIQSNFDTDGLLPQCLQWKDAILVPHVQRSVGTISFAEQRWDDRLRYAVYEAFVRVRSEELFDLVAEYPDSLPAVGELSAALDGTGRILYQSLAYRWRMGLVQRLLHPGAQTNQIIDVYISTIKVLRRMDASGELLHVVTRPVREYLRGREDTVRCIITSLTEEEGDLYEELQRQDARPLEEAQLQDLEDEDPPTFDWEPPPSILQRRGVITGRLGQVGSSSKRAGDILSMLVGIYGSKELFVNEYRIMLADKLLSNLDYDTDKEVHTVELLKLRFGEESMRQCEVMIKDIDDSKRVYSNIWCPLDMKASSEDDPPCLDAAIVSHIFWPPLQRDDMKHHYRIESQMDNFATEYAILKNPRRLVWMKQLGHVELEVELYETDDEGNVVSHVKEVKCTPVHATLLAHFEDKPFWTVEELSTETEMSDEMLKKRMAFWVNQHVVQQTRYGYSLISVHDAHSSEQSFVDHDDDDDRDHAVSFGAHEEEEMKVYESYIVGMLSNLGQIPLEKIHTMLKTFVTGSDHKFTKTPQQLAVFLQQLCKEEKLECSPDGLYNLLKKRS
ncbi:hypothetical protein HJC23_003243 [Cyclotella cryptica]|uniref:Anaphase-promoting complex subunit 2 n=1 Tax=Cyclotella cryptica TaxID=29204 RepID=A0ABD3QXA4_9STRA|eukprot:CCRYP_000776-RA/>CCRYP_000776-RA protein AED:0.28 eAED:0.28 QI:0/-1/0/1/-1/1/1/0/738